MTDEEVTAELNSLIAFLKHEKRQPTSCTPDIVRRLNKAIDKHLVANGEPPFRRAA